jgi:hypothetical protein
LNFFFKFLGFLGISFSAALFGANFFALKIQSNTRRLESDFKTESQLLEADKGRRVTRRSLRR